MPTESHPIADYTDAQLRALLAANQRAREQSAERSQTRFAAERIIYHVENELARRESRWVEE